MRSFWSIVAMVGLIATTSAAEDLRLGYLAMGSDPRFDEKNTYARIQISPPADSSLAFSMAIEDLALLTDSKKLTVSSDLRKVAAQELIASAEAMRASGIKHLIVDLPAAEVDALAAALAGSDILLYNTTAPEDWLRSKCHSNLLHTAASDRMLADAVAQHLVLRDWTNVLLLKGKTGRDERLARSYVEAFDRMRVRVVDERTFDLSTNPELREENNIALLTGGLRDYDVIVVADTVGEFSRYVPYQTSKPRPVLGATGLTPLEWHWSLERYGAPQVNSRFEARTDDGRRMTWQDWSVWIAARAALTAEVKSRDRSFAGVSDYIRSHRFKFDGSKGVAMSFRPWSGQLRMPILLATQNAIIATAPVEGFEHQNNVLDSLGRDDAEFICDD